ncbi:MAG: hypothetical protein JW874_15465 [Spirochaetales bacterium]|nr:hypothetical protein [Spirochaetales bacterium]
MKRIVYLLILAAALLVMGSCDVAPKTGPLEGMEIYLDDGLDNGSQSGSNRVAPNKGINTTQKYKSKDTDYAVPDGVEIALTKIWFPTPETFETLKASNPDHDMGQIFVNVTTDFSGLEFYKALDRDSDNPYVFNTAASEPFTPDTNPPYGAVYNGVLLETVYFQMDMPTYSIRWYSKDSGAYLAQDVLVNDGSGWKFAYLKRTIEFDFINSSIETNKVQNQSVTGIELVTQADRLSAGQYFENWYMNDANTIDREYVWRALGIYNYPSQSYSLRYYYQNLHNPPGGDFTDLTLDQYFRVTRDVPNNSNPTYDHIGESLATGYWNENGGLLIKAELIAGYDPDAYDNPKVIEIFTEEENEAKLYKIEISFASNNPDAFACGLGIDSLPDSLDGDSTWPEIVSHVAAENLVSLSPITGGKEIAFGWLDFNDMWQGEFSEEAGQ